MTDARSGIRNFMMLILYILIIESRLIVLATALTLHTSNSHF